MQREPSMNLIFDALVIRFLLQPSQRTQTKEGSFQHLTGSPVNITLT